MASGVQQCWGLPTNTLQRDSCKLPWKSGSVDVTVTDMPFGKGWASRRETGTFSELACGLCLQTGDRLSCMLAQDKTWEARGAASPGHHPERDMYGRRGLVSGGRRRSSSCCGLTSEKCSSNFCSSFRTRWRKTSLVMRRMKMTKSIYASVHSSHGMETT